MEDPVWLVWVFAAMIAGWTMEVIYTTRCRVCDAVDVQSYRVASHEELPRPRYPEGWHTYDMGAICHRHTLMISFPDADPNQVVLAPYGAST